MDPILVLGAITALRRMRDPIERRDEHQARRKE
jgi:hypothetical protein